MSHTNMTTTTTESTAPEGIRRAESVEEFRRRSILSAKVDGVGATCSAACTLHCALASLVPGAFAFLGLGALVGPHLETGFVAAALLFACLAFGFGYRQHRILGIAALFLLGITGLAGGRLLEKSGSEVGSSVTTVAGLLLVAAHAGSWWITRRQRLATRMPTA